MMQHFEVSLHCEYCLLFCAPSMFPGNHADADAVQAHARSVTAPMVPAQC